MYFWEFFWNSCFRFNVIFFYFVINFILNAAVIIEFVDSMMCVVLSSLLVLSFFLFVDFISYLLALYIEIIRTLEELKNLFNVFLGVNIEDYKL